MHSNPSPFLRSISQHMIVRRYSKRTIKTYIGWIKYFITYHEKRHPSELDSSHVEQFLTFLAVDRKVAAATQKIVLNALAFRDRPHRCFRQWKQRWGSRPYSLPLLF